MWRSISRHWFLLALAGCLVIGFSWPSILAPFAHSSALRTGIIAVVMVLMGWTLDPRSIVGNIRRPLPSILAIGVNVVVVPLLAWPALWILPTDLAGGLIVAALVPCTLASATVWTRAAGGDDAVAMMTTVVTNVFCFLVAPFGIWLLLRQQTQTDIGSQMSGLFVQVVAPLMGGQGLRFLGLAGWADRRKVPLAIIAQTGILLMVMLGSVISAERMAANPAQAGSYGAIAGTAVVCWIVHLAAVGVGYFAAVATSLPRAQQIAIAISGGQKTLMVGLQLALGCGVSVMPMVLYHIGQLLIDTLLVRYWVNRSLAISSLAVTPPADGRGEQKPPAASWGKP